MQRTEQQTLLYSQVNYDICKGIITTSHQLDVVVDNSILSEDDIAHLMIERRYMWGQC